MIQEHLEKASGEGNVDGRLQVQLEEGGGGGSRQSSMELSSLWTVIHCEHKSSKSIRRVRLVRRPRHR